MCNVACIWYVVGGLSKYPILGKDILEVGSYNVNGSASFELKKRMPNSYVGVDIAPGPCVDKICNVTELISTFGKSSFDVVITTEMLEHVEDWRAAIRNLKGVCRQGGHIIITTRSKGFPLHNYPDDWWRFEVADMTNIFSDCDIVSVQKDPQDIGVFVHAIKTDRAETDLDKILLYNIQFDSFVR
jgi:SAM-dependent methyltransferase